MCNELVITTQFNPAICCCPLSLNMPPNAFQLLCHYQVITKNHLVAGTYIYNVTNTLAESNTLLGNIIVIQLI